MKEQQSPPQTLEDRFSDYHESPFLTFGYDISVAGDPETADEFSTALCYLQLITERFIKSGEFWQKTATDVNDRLTYYNAHHRYEVEQEHEVGEKSTTYREITPRHLRALSERMVQALEDTGWEVTEAYRMACFLHSLVEQAVADYEATQELLNLTAPAIYLVASEDDDIPF